MMQEGHNAMRLRMWMFRGHGRVNRGMLQWRLYRMRGLFLTLLTMVVLLAVVACAWAIRLFAGLLG